VVPARLGHPWGDAILLPAMMTAPIHGINLFRGLRSWIFGQSKLSRPRPP
jgi:hypothetical protein